MKKILGISLCLFLMGFSSKDPNEGYSICLKTFASTKAIKTLSYTMYKQERIKETLKTQLSQSKLQYDPYKVYVKQLSPKKGVEVLFNTSTSPEKVLINPNSFPWINLNVHPNSWIMRKDQHHSIRDGGFNLVVSILEHLFIKYGNAVKSKVRLNSIVKYNNIRCYKVIFDNPDFKYEPYFVKKDENILDIAQRLKISEYMILELNKKLDGYYDVNEGDEILIPNDYSPRMELLIDEERLIPLSVKVFDDKGLYEYFRYTDVIINPEFTDLDFDKDNENYGF